MGDISIYIECDRSFVVHGKPLNSDFSAISESPAVSPGADNPVSLRIAPQPDISILKRPFGK